MGTADEQIRISSVVKQQLETRRREGESYNDVLERVLGDCDRDLLAGFGRWSDEEAESVRKRRQRAKRDAKERLVRRSG